MTQSTFSDEQILHCFNLLDDQVIALEKQLSEIKENREQMRLELHARMLAQKEAGEEKPQIRLFGGDLAYFRVMEHAKLKDWSVFREWVIGNKQFDLLPKDVNSTECLKYFKAHGALPPGTQLFTALKVHVRRQREE